MIFSPSQQFVFFAIPKTGTHAIREVFRPHLGTEDWEQQLRYGQQLSPLPEIAAINHGHVAYRQLARVIPEETLAQYFTFAFVRHPFDRFVSVCAFLARTDPSYQDDPTAWMKRALTRAPFRKRVLVATQSDLLTCEHSGSIKLDFVGRYESLQSDCDHICQTLSLPAVPLSRKNSSKHRQHHEVLDDELRETLTERYADDFETFSYDP